MISQIDTALARLRSEIEGRLGTHLDTLNRSTRNRLGWVISNDPLENDPRSWEFSFTPAAAEVLDLAGLWRFALDPKNEGTAAGFARPDFDDSAWDWIFAPNRHGWERLGYDQDNPEHRGRNNKPYNGHAWYRKTVFIPDAWGDRDLELQLGVRDRNRDWIYVNGEPLGDVATRENGSAVPRLLVPATLIRAGTTNTLAIHVLNRENRGGLLGPRLRLYPIDSQPEMLRSVCQAGIVQAGEYTSGIRQVAYCGALSPGILVAQTGKQFRLWGWEAKGYVPPGYVAYLSGREERVY
jgi:hypothetical protein